MLVAPFAGAWIEIFDKKVLRVLVLSLPSRERGLKLTQKELLGRIGDVAPFAGAWIEIEEKVILHQALFVAGAWIEIIQF